MTKISDAIKGTVEFVRGQTGLACVMRDTIIVRPPDQSSAVFCARSEREMVSGVHPSAMIASAFEIDIRGSISVALSDSIPGWQEATVLDQNGDICYITLRFLLHMPAGGAQTFMRNLAFRDGLLRQIV
jgi:hypothetical protein